MRPETVSSMRAQVFDGELVWHVSRDNPFEGERNMANINHQHKLGRKMALDGGYDAMLIVEHDMLLPVGCIQKLWDTPAPVVYAAYMLRHGQKVVNLFRKEGKNVGMSISLYRGEVARARRWGVLEVSGAGFGCTLIRREALERIPFRGTDSPSDLPFAADCLKHGLLQLGRMDVACGHIDDDGRLLTVSELADQTARVLALQNVVTPSGPMKKDRYYSIDAELASELQRAGFVRITNPPGDPVREVSVAEDRETATVAKRTPRKRKRVPRNTDKAS